MRSIKRRLPRTLNTIEVAGLEMAYTDEGSGQVILFLHGGIGSTYMWRDVIPHLTPHARCIAVDMMGTGRSSRYLTGPNAPYGWRDHTVFLGTFLERLKIADVAIVMHGWASIIGLGWARYHEDQVRGLAYMEAVTRPMAWHELPESYREILKLARSEDGERYVMSSDDYFEDAVATQMVNGLDRDLVLEYRSRLGDFGEERRALHRALVETPVGGQPSESAYLVRGIGDWLKQSPIPKLLILGEPGYWVTEFGRRAARGISNQSVVRVSGRHLLPEESPGPVGMFLRLWVDQLR